MGRPRILLIGAVATLSALACQKAFSPVYLLDKPRILAIRSEPVDLVPGGTVALDALVYLPQGSPTPQYAWTWCASLGGSSTGYACSITADQLTQMIDPDGGLGVTISYALGADPTATFGYPASSDVLKSLCSRPSGDAGMPGLDASEADGSATAGDEGGDGGGAAPTPGSLFCRDSMTVNVLLTVQVGSESLQATRTLTLYLNAPAAINSNPAIDGLMVPATVVTTADGGALPDGAIGILAAIPASASEQYSVAAPGAPGDGGVGPTNDGGSGLVSSDAGLLDDADAGDGGRQGPQQGPRYEALDLAWYVEAGQLGKATTSLASTGVSESRDWQPLLQNWWIPPARSSAVQYEFILVVRDDRGGIAWLQQAASGQ